MNDNVSLGMTGCDIDVVQREFRPSLSPNHDQAA